MEPLALSKDTNWFFLTLPAFLGSNNLLDPYIIISLVFAFFAISLITWAYSPGGIAWNNGRNHQGPIPIPGPRGIPFFGSLFSLSRGLAHRSLALKAKTLAATQLMAFSLGSTPVVVSSNHIIAREILTSSHFADRPIKSSARLLMFSRAIGFAPNGTYWRLLRKISSTHLFSPSRILAHSPHRQLECTIMMSRIAAQQSSSGRVSLRKYLQDAALNNIMTSVFGRRYDLSSKSVERDELNDMVREGFELLGAFNWSDYIPWLSYVYDPVKIAERCGELVPRVRRLVGGIIEEHRLTESKELSDNGDFVDVLLSLEGKEKLDKDDMIAVLWEMIFRGTDTTALLTEWVMAELVLHPEIQAKLFKELQSAVANNTITDTSIAKVPYLQAVVKETLRIHPPGPLLSWARLSTSDVQLSNGMMIPAHTTAMVNMWAITHDPNIWEDPNTFNPERFIDADVDVRGGDLRLAPFGAGRRVCPGKNLGLATVSMWVAELVSCFEWVSDVANPVDLTEVLKLSCEMKHPLSAVALPRNVSLF